MGIDASKVFMPTPDQTAVTGAVAVAPIGTALPKTAREKLTEEWVSGGYVGDAGLAVSTNKGTTVIKDWSQATVRKALSDVHVEAANNEHGNILAIDLGANMPETESYVFSMKDGDSRVRVIVPRGQITAIDAINFVPNAANTWPATLSCYPGDEGWAIRVIYEDGTIIEK